MEEKIRKAIEEKAAGRPYNLIRHVGNRLEVHYLGDYVVTNITIGEAGGKGEALSSHKKSYLVKMASEMGIKTSRLTKIELIQAIIEEGKQSTLKGFETDPPKIMRDENR